MSKEIRKLRSTPEGDDVTYPYVEVDAIKFVFQGKGDFKEVTERSKINVAGGLNSRPEVMEAYRKKGWQIISCGNLDDSEPHKILKDYVEQIVKDREYAKAEAKKELKGSGRQQAQV